jgi:hypothetical protein
MTNNPRPDTAPKGDDRPQAKGERSPLERMRDLTRRIINVPKSDIPQAKSTKRKPH